MDDDLEKYNVHVNEANELPDPQRSLLTHNERELIEFCFRMRDAITELVTMVRELRPKPSPKELAVAARAHEPTFRCPKCRTTSYTDFPWCKRENCPGKGGKHDPHTTIEVKGDGAEDTDGEGLERPDH